MATLKIGSIGAGGRGRICKLAHQPENDVELKAVCDVPRACTHSLTSAVLSKS